MRDIYFTFTLGLALNLIKESILGRTPRPRPTGEIHGYKER